MMSSPGSASKAQPQTPTASDSSSVSSSSSGDLDDDGGGGEEEGSGDSEVNPYDGLPFSSRYYFSSEERQRLPVWELRQSLSEHSENHSMVSSSAPSGAGKSTQVAQWCVEFASSFEFSHGSVCCSQPHPEAAPSSASRVADEMDSSSGSEVGYRVSHDDSCTPDTSLRFVSDASLSEEMMSAPSSPQYGSVISDESQQRTVSTDVSSGSSRDVCRQRPHDFRVVLSAHPASAPRSAAFSGPAVPHSSSDGSERGGGVESMYRELSPGKDPVWAACHMVSDSHRRGEEGDVMVFSASSQEVEECLVSSEKECVASSPQSGSLRFVPSHSGSGSSTQRVYESDPGAPLKEGDQSDGVEAGASGVRRKVVLSDASGEASFSSQGIRYVVDTGLQMKTVYNPQIRANSQVSSNISKHQADMRSQKISSRLPGSCLRSYSQSRYETGMSESVCPGVMEENSSHSVSSLKRSDIADMGQCKFSDRPAPEASMQALEDSDYSAASDDDGNSSEVGIIMSESPSEPPSAKASIAACEYDCVEESSTIAAMLTAPPCFSVPDPSKEETAVSAWRPMMHSEGDHMTLINVYNAFMEHNEDEAWCAATFSSHAALRLAVVIRAELSEVMQRIELPVSPPAFGCQDNCTNIKRALISGFFLKVAHDVDGSGNYLLSTHRHVTHLHPFSSYRCRQPCPSPPSWVLYHEFTISRDNCIRIASEVHPQMLVESAPQYFSGNLPSSDGKEISMELRQSLAPPSGEMESDHSRTQKDGDKTGETPNHSTTELCVVQ